MADYKRMISYIYNYERGIKKSNVGYARIEIRGGQCKVTVHVKTPSIKDSLKVCFFFRKEEAIYAIELGETDVQNGTADFQTIVLENDLMDTSYTFDEMSGMIVYVSKEKFFGSEWDDRPIQMDDFRFVDKNDRKGKESLQLEKAVGEEASGNVDAEPEDKEGETTKKEGTMEHVATWEPSKENVSGADDNIKEDWKDKASEERVDEQENVTEIACEDAVNKEAALESGNHQVQAADVTARMLDFQKTVTKTVKRTERNVSSGRQIKKDKKSVDFAEYLMEEYPKMYPFEDDEILSCVRIEPQDIGMFPMEIWPLANNSFLLQGYYSYRHLIFARTKIANKETYLLGVPGIYHNREEFMARMFGFHLFKPVKRRENKRGEFGYWFYSLRMPRRR